MIDEPSRRAERFRMLFDLHARSVLGCAARRVASQPDAADVVAETVLVAWRRLDDVPPGDAARPWLFATARRVLANAGVAISAAHISPTDYGLTSALVSTNTAPAVEGVAVRAALARLDEDDRDLILLSAWEGFTPAELAAVTGQPASTVRSRLSRAREHLRLALFAEQERTEQACRRQAHITEECP